jgi:hypothetical protein
MHPLSYNFTYVVCLGLPQSNLNFFSGDEAYNRSPSRFIAQAKSYNIARVQKHVDMARCLCALQYVGFLSLTFKNLQRLI